MRPADLPGVAPFPESLLTYSQLYSPLGVVDSDDCFGGSLAYWLSLSCYLPLMSDAGPGIPDQKAPQSKTPCVCLLGVGNLLVSHCTKEVIFSQEHWSCPPWMLITSCTVIQGVRSLLPSFLALGSSNNCFKPHNFSLLLLFSFLKKKYIDMCVYIYIYIYVCVCVYIHTYILSMRLYLSQTVFPMRGQEIKLPQGDSDPPAVAAGFP